MMEAKVVVFGCGNTLRGDDGLGPTVVQQLDRAHGKAQAVAFVDAGTSLRSLLFDLLLSEATPERIIVFDAVEEAQRKVGSVHTERILPSFSGYPENTGAHLAPTRQLLQTICAQTGIEVILLTVQVEMLSQKIESGLSETAQKTVPEARRIVEDLCAPYLNV